MALQKEKVEERKTRSAKDSALLSFASSTASLVTDSLNNVPVTLKEEGRHVISSDEYLNSENDHSKKTSSEFLMSTSSENIDMEKALKSDYGGESGPSSSAVNLTTNSSSEKESERWENLFITCLHEDLAKVNNWYLDNEKEIIAEANKLLGLIESIEEQGIIQRFNMNHFVIHETRPRSRKSSLIDTFSSFLGRSSQNNIHSQSNQIVSTTLEDVESNGVNNTLSVIKGPLIWDHIQDEDTRVRVNQQFSLPATWQSGTSALDQNSSRLKLERSRLIHCLKDVFISLANLKDYSDLNYTAFSKITKKHDKYTGKHLKQIFIPNYVNNSPFRVRLRVLNETVIKVEQAFVKLEGGSDERKKQESLNQLHHSLRDHIIWERNNIWKEMVARERKISSLHTVPHPPIIKVKPTKFIYSSKFRKYAYFVFGLCLLFTCVFGNLFPTPEMNNCLGLLMFCLVLWLFEVLPLFVTSMLVPFLAVTLQVLRDDKTGQRLNALGASKVIFHEMFSQVIMLLLGGFAIAAALSKLNIAKSAALKILSKCSTSNPGKLILAFIAVSTFASMWISNVAAPVLCFSIMEPIVNMQPSESSLSKSLIMAVALAANVGGMASPISSPQNVFAINYLKGKVSGSIDDSVEDKSPNWLQWLAVSIPLCILADLAIWIIVYYSYQPFPPPASSTAATAVATNEAIYQNQLSPIKMMYNSQISTNIEKFEWKHYFVLIVSAFTILLWCLNSSLSSVTGEMGILAIIPLVAFFGSGILSKDDFHSFLWTVVMLAQGGLALGAAVRSSGLLAEIGHRLTDSVDGYSLWIVVAFFGFIVLILTTFISHTVGAMILLPLVFVVGSEMQPEAHSRLLVMMAALMCSAGMGLPISGFPNMTAMGMENAYGNNYVTTKDFLKVGIISSVVVYLLIVSIGYGIMVGLLGW